MQTSFQNRLHVVLIAIAYLFGCEAIAVVCAFATYLADEDRLWPATIVLALSLVWGFFCGRWAARDTGWGVRAGVWTGVAAVALQLLPGILLLPLAFRGASADFLSLLRDVSLRLAIGGTVSIVALAIAPILGARYEVRHPRPTLEPSPPIA